jgi:hypothetical protein
MLVRWRLTVPWAMYSVAVLPTAVASDAQRVGAGAVGLGGEAAAKAVLHNRHDEGVADGRTLYEEIRGRGYRGTLRTLQRCAMNERPDVRR